jgi:hypothetical protein
MEENTTPLRSNRVYLHGEIVSQPTLKLNKDRVYEQLFMLKVKRSDNINYDIFLIRDQKADSFISKVNIAKNVTGATYRGVTAEVYGEVILTETNDVEIFVSAETDSYARGVIVPKATACHKSNDLQSLDHY